MVDLIPIGTINRTTTENNSIKKNPDVEQAAGAKGMDDNRVQGGLDRRRTVDRRRNHDRRGRARGMKERRKLQDRRGAPRAASAEDRRKTAKKRSRKGRIIDERV